MCLLFKFYLFSIFKIYLCKVRFMSYKHINLIFKIIAHMGINQKKKKFFLKFKKEFLPLLIFLKKKNIIYSLFIIKKKYILIYLKILNNIQYLKKIKVFNFRNHEYKKYLMLIFLKKKNLFKYCIIFTNHGLYSFEDSITKQKGGMLITTLN